MRVRWSLSVLSAIIYDAPIPSVEGCRCRSLRLAEPAIGRVQTLVRLLSELISGSGDEVVELSAGWAGRRITSAYRVSLKSKHPGYLIDTIHARPNFFLSKVVGWMGAAKFIARIGYS